MKIGEFFKENTLLCDGAMGTYYASKFHDETLVERENFEHPELHCPDSRGIFRKWSETAPHQYICYQFKLL